MYVPALFWVAKKQQKTGKKSCLSHGVFILWGGTDHKLNN